MTAFPTYSTGTVSIGASATSVVGAGGANWTGANAKPGDTLVVAGHQVIVQDVTDSTHLVIDAWPFTAVSAGTAYVLYKTSPLRFVGGDAMADVSTLVAALNTDGFYVFVPSTATVPDPSYGNDGQYAFQASTGKLWIKTGGAWSFIGIYKAFGVAAPWSAVTAYQVNDVATLSGTSYVCILGHTNQTPPNATYWVVLAAKGDTGATAWTAPAAWLTATAYVAGPPASVVTQGGESYVCLVAHTSGTFATDLAAAKWIKVAQKGDGYGGTSATSLAIGTGSKVFTTQAGLAYLVGNYVRASSAANGANYMEGFVTAYSGTSLTVNVTKVGGSGTLADWNFATAGAPGSGDLLSTNNLSEVNPATASTNLGVVRYGGAQSLSTAEKAQARSNVFKGPTTQIFTSGSGTYTTPANVLWIEIELVGGGAGGAGSGTSPGNGGAGGATTWGTGPILTSGVASGAVGATGGAGGAPSGGFVNKTGATGGNGSGLNATTGGFGANSPYGGAGVGGAAGAGAGIAAAANTGSGGGGGGVNTTVNGGGGGGAGGFVRAIINSPLSTYSYVVGAAGTAGTTGGTGAAGGAGGSGFLQVTEHYV